jgi:hypothetical protein
MTATIASEAIEKNLCSPRSVRAPVSSAAGTNAVAAAAGVSLGVSEFPSLDQDDSPPSYFLTFCQLILVTLRGALTMPAQ